MLLYVDCCILTKRNMLVRSVACLCSCYTNFICHLIHFLMILNYTLPYLFFLERNDFVESLHVYTNIICSQILWASCCFFLKVRHRLHRKIHRNFTSKFIVIEGLIGVGKTTLCKILQKKMSINFRTCRRQSTFWLRFTRTPKICLSCSNVLPAFQNLAAK